MNVIDCALKMEEEARLHYEELAAAAPTPELRTLFSLLTAAEREHRHALEKIKEGVAAPETGFVALNEASCVFRALLSKRELLAGLKNDSDAYQHVIKEEQESVKLYEELAAKAEDGDTRNLLLMIAEEERRHLNIVENIYSFLESPKTYLAWGEFSNLREY